MEAAKSPMIQSMDSVMAVIQLARTVAVSTAAVNELSQAYLDSSSSIDDAREKSGFNTDRV